MSESSGSKRNELAGRWAWLLPAAYVFHVIEEAFGGNGLMKWMADGGGAELSTGAFLCVNLFGFSALCLAAWAAGRWRLWQWPLVSGAVIFVTNGIWHLAVCITTQSYVPGVLTGLVLYVPIGVTILIRSRHVMSRRVFVSAAIFGFVIHRVTLWIVLGTPMLQL
jgi:hypothetical protein